MEIELRQVIRAAIRWAWLIALTTVLAGVVAFMLTKGQTATYSATTTLLVNPQQVTSSTDNSQLQASRSQADTYVRLVESGPVLDRVVKELNLPITSSELANKVEATTVINTQLIEITVKDPSPKQAALIANSVANAFEQRVDDLTTGRLEANLKQASSESSALRARMAEIDAKLADLDTDANRNNADIQTQISALKEERSRAQETTADLDATIRSINSSLATTTSPVAVADEAQAAREPDSPKPALMTALGLFLGFLIGCGLAALLQLTDRKVRPETDVEALTGTRLLTIVPQARKPASSREPVLVAAPDSPAAEAVRLLRTHLQGFVEAHPHGTLALAYAGEGTQGADLLANMGIALAQSGTSTLLVDADIRTPHLHQLFASENGPGLAAVLTGGAENGGGTDIARNLCLVSAGTTTDHPAGLVSSSSFARAMRDLSSRADFTLISAPPALAYSDALSIASVADGVLLVGRYGETSRDDLAALATTIREDGMTLVGVVMIRA